MENWQSPLDSTSPGDEKDSSAHPPLFHLQHLLSTYKVQGDTKNKKDNLSVRPEKYLPFFFSCLPPRNEH